MCVFIFNLMGTKWLCKDLNKNLTILALWGHLDGPPKGNVSFLMAEVEVNVGV